MLRHAFKKSGFAVTQRVSNRNLPIRPNNHIFSCIHNDSNTKINPEQTKNKFKDNDVNSFIENSSAFRSFSVASNLLADDILNPSKDPITFEKSQVDQNNITEASHTDEKKKCRKISEAEAEADGDGGDGDVEPLLESKLFNLQGDETSNSKTTNESSILNDQKGNLNHSSEDIEKETNQNKNKKEKKQNQGSHYFERRLSIAISKQNLSGAMYPFWKLSDRNDISIRTENLVGLLDLACKENDVFASYKVLQKLNIQYKRDTTKNLDKSTSHPVPISLYISLCQSLKETKKSPRRQHVSSVISYLSTHLQSLDFETYQKEIFPEFFLSVLSQPDFNLVHSGDIWAYIQHKGISCPNHILENMLNYSFLKVGSQSPREAKRRDVPFIRVLEQLVEDNYRVDSRTVTQTLLNEHPFINVKKTTKILHCIKKLYESKEDGDPLHEYRISASMLDSIAVSAAKFGDTDLLLLVWDLIDMMGYKPSESMFENAIHGFMIAYKQDHHAFAVMAEMEKEGYIPSRALTQMIAKSLSYSVGRIDNAYYILINNTEGTNITTSSINCILAAYGKVGHLDNAFSTYDLFEEKGLVPDSETFSYLLQAIATDMKNTIFPSKNRNEKENLRTQEYDSGAQLESAYETISIMNDFKVSHTSDSIHYLARILTFSSKLDEAKALIHDAREKKITVKLETLRLLLTQYLNSGDITSSNEVCDAMRAVAKDHGFSFENENDIVPLYLKERLDLLEKDIVAKKSRVDDKIEDFS